MADWTETLDLEQLNAMPAEALLRWAWEARGGRAALFTSFQKTGCVMMDMAHRTAPGLRVLTVDTLRLPQETHDVMAALEAKYGLRIERFAPDPERVARMVGDHGEYLFFDSREKQEHCCAVRKVEPNRRALATVDIWITGLRRDQSAFRKATPKAAVVVQDGRTLLKLCPLIDWTGEAVDGYIAANGVPYNGLYDKGYTSIGCVVCSTPTRPGEDPRAGRWRWMNQLAEADKKECGIHTQGSGI
jgi:phosphoadenylyl-sulfate reductase (thioredoxin)